MATITTIAAPALNSSNYGTQLKEVFKNIDDNFKSVAHLPFLRGTQGTNIDISVVGLYEVDPRTGELLVVDSQHPFTVLGKHLVTAIFETTECSTYEQLEAYCASTARFEPLRSGSENTACRNLRFREGEEDENIYITLFSTKTANNDEVTVTEEYTRYLASDGYFAFRDARLRDISMDYDAVTDFIDASCLVVRMYNSDFDEYEFVKTQMLPTIYYSTTSNSYCWEINGVRTEISASGLQGERGDTAGCWVLRADDNVPVVPQNDNIQNNMPTTYYIVPPVQWLSGDVHIENNEVVSASAWQPIQNNSYFNEHADTGDLCIISFVANDGTANGHHEMAYGVINKTEISNTVFQYSVIVSQAETFTEYFDIESLELRSALNNIGYDSQSTGYTGLRGLYIPSQGNNVHLIYSNNNTHDINVVETNISQTYPNTLTPEPLAVNGEIKLQNYLLNVPFYMTTNGVNVDFHSPEFTDAVTGNLTIGRSNMLLVAGSELNYMPIWVTGNSNIGAYSKSPLLDTLTNSEIFFDIKTTCTSNNYVDFDNSYVHINIPVELTHSQVSAQRGFLFTVNGGKAKFTDSVRIDGALNCGSSLQVIGTATCSSNLVVDGTTTLNGTVTVNNNLIVTGNVGDNTPSRISTDCLRIGNHTTSNPPTLMGIELRYAYDDTNNISKILCGVLEQSATDLPYYTTKLRLNNAQTMSLQDNGLDLCIVHTEDIEDFIETYGHVYYFVGIPTQQ